MDCFTEPVGAHSRDPVARNDGKRPFFVIARSEATKQSILSLRSEMDCFAALAMTERHGLLHGARRRAFARPVGSQRREAPFLRHCEERSDEAIQSFFAQRDGLLRCARNDGEGYTVCLRRPAPAGKPTSSSWSPRLQVPCGKSPDGTMTVAVVQRFGIN